MPTRNVNLSDELDAFIEQRVQSGQYGNASEVIRAALRELQQAEEEDKAKVIALRQAIADGLEGPYREGPTVMREVKERIRVRTASKAFTA